MVQKQEQKAKAKAKDEAKAKAKAKDEAKAKAKAKDGAKAKAKGEAKARAPPPRTPHKVHISFFLFFLGCPGPRRYRPASLDMTRCAAKYDRQKRAATARREFPAR